MRAIRRESKTRLGLALVTLVLGTACSHEQVYNAVQENRIQDECTKLPQAQYEECMEAYSQPYDEYEREREAVLNAEGG